jgi:hypothetical protein
MDPNNLDGLHDFAAISTARMRYDGLQCWMEVPFAYGVELLRSASASAFLF